MLSHPITDGQRLDLIRPLFANGPIETSFHSYNLVDDTLEIEGHDEHGSGDPVREMVEDLLDNVHDHDDIDARDVVVAATSLGYYMAMPDTLDERSPRVLRANHTQSMLRGADIDVVCQDGESLVAPQRAATRKAMAQAADRNHFLVVRLPNDRDMREQADLAVGYSADAWLVFAPPGAPMTSKRDVCDFVNAARRGHVDAFDTLSGQTFLANGADAAALITASQGAKILRDLPALDGRRQLDGLSLDKAYAAVKKEAQGRVDGSLQHNVRSQATQQITAPPRAR